jgi:hypothetical protein
VPGGRMHEQRGHAATARVLVPEARPAEIEVGDEG